MSLAFESTLRVAPAQLIQGPAGIQAESSLNINVVFTSVEATLTALRAAGTLANRLYGHITLLAPQVVPYPLPLTSPPVLLDWNERRFRDIASDSAVETKVFLYLCRDRAKTLIDVLSPHSIVVLGGLKRLWPTSETRLAKTLRRAGHDVIFKETE